MAMVQPSLEGRSSCKSKFMSWQVALTLSIFSVANQKAGAFTEDLLHKGS